MVSSTPAGSTIASSPGPSRAPAAQRVDAETPRQLGEPRADRVVVAQLVELLVRAREHFLEDVLGVVLWQAKPLDDDRVDVAREAVDELAPGVLDLPRGNARPAGRRSPRLP